MKALVTGANGFIGKPLTRALSLAGWQVVPAVRRRSRISDETIITDIDENTRWQNALFGCDAVIHLAAQIHATSSDTVKAATEYHVVNTEGTLNLARQAAQAGVRRFIFLSSIKVNGDSSSIYKPFVEEDKPLPSDSYAISKLQAEIELLKLTIEYDMEVVIIRPPLVYGPGVKGNFRSMVNWVLSGVPLPFGAIDNQRSLIALDNLIDFVTLCADREKSPRAANEVFLVSDGLDVSTSELLLKVAYAYGTNARLIHVPEPWLRLAFRLVGKSAAADRLFGSLSVDITKARQGLGWRPPVTMEEQLLKMAQDATSV